MKRHLDDCHVLFDALVACLRVQSQKSALGPAARNKVSRDRPGLVQGRSRTGSGPVLTLVILIGSLVVIDTGWLGQCCPIFVKIQPTFVICHMVVGLCRLGGPHRI